jgi:hypothetical protein
MLSTLDMLVFTYVIRFSNMKYVGMYMSLNKFYFAFSSLTALTQYPRLFKVSVLVVGTFFWHRLIGPDVHE